MRARTQIAVYSRRTAQAVAFEPLDQRRDRQGWWIGDQQMHVVGFAVELDQLDIEFGAHGTHGVLAEGEHLAGEHRPAMPGHGDMVHMQQRHTVSGKSLRLVCQWWVLRCGCADG
jgi:hypothetical protein